MHLPAEGEYYCFSGKARKTFRTSSLFTITYNFSPRASLSFYGAGCCLSLAQSATVKIKNIVASADMRRHSDTLRGAKRRRKRGLRGENRISEANSVVFPSFSERGLTGENARANAVSRRALSPVLSKEGSTGRKQNKRSEFCCLPVIPRKRGQRGENRISEANSVVFPSFPERGG